MKERITITINSDLLHKVDEKVDGTSIKNRSHAIELFLGKFLSRQSISTAVILAGGKDKLTIDRKEIHAPMLPIANKPIIEHLVSMLKRQGVNHFIICVGYKKDDIMQHFGDGTNHGVHITYIEEDEALGTAGALKKASEHLTSTFIVCNGDELKKIDLKELLQFHRQQGTCATIALTTASDVSEYGVILLNGNKVFEFIEKPTSNVPSNLINAGLYVFEPEALSAIPEGFARLEEDVFPKLAKADDLSGYVFYGKWQDVKTKKSYEKATKEWTI